MIDNTQRTDDPIFSEDSSVWDFMTIGAAAELTRINVKTIYRWTACGQLRAYGYRGCLRVRCHRMIDS